MSNTFNLRAASAALVLASFAVSPLCAQTEPSGPQQDATPPAAAAAAAPASKGTGDWGVRCATSASQTPCEMQQFAMQNKTGRRVLSVSLAFVPSSGRYIFQLGVPLGVSFAKGVKIIANGYNSGPMGYRRCDSSGCFVEGIMEAKAVDEMAHATGPAKVEFAAVEGRTIDLPLSLRGFADARKDMEDRARQKTAKP